MPETREFLCQRCELLKREIAELKKENEELRARMDEDVHSSVKHDVGLTEQMEQDWYDKLIEPPGYGIADF